MVRQFRPVDRDQPMMLPEDMRLWVGKDHLVWFVIDVVGELDVSGLERLGKPGRGRPGYDPRMLAVLLVYACLQGVRSSRRIEERCRTDAAFRVATGNQVPDHAAIARFRAAAAGEGGPLEDLFLQVLFVLAAAGPGRLDVVSVDGSKIWASASKQANRTEGGLRRLARKVLDDAARCDGQGCGCAGRPAGPGAARQGGGGPPGPRARGRGAGGGRPCGREEAREAAGAGAEHHRPGLQGHALHPAGRRPGL
jgi:transposase